MVDHVQITNSHSRTWSPCGTATLVTRWPDLELVPDQEIPFHPNISFRGSHELWVSGRRCA